MKLKTVLGAIGLLLVLVPSSCGRGCDEEVASILRRQTVRFTQPPSRIPSQVSVDAPLLGNGSTGVAIAGTPDSLVFYLARNDFWRLKSAHDEGYPLVLGTVGVSIPGLKGASYQVDQHLYEATTDAVFSKDARALTCEAYVAATEDVLVIRVRNAGKEDLQGTVRLCLPPDNGVFRDVRESGTTREGVSYILRAFEEEVDIPTRAAVAMTARPDPDGSFTLAPGKELMVACAFSSNFKSADCLKTVVERLSSFGPRQERELLRAHRRWWKDYWSKSYVSLPDPDIERQYYRSLYGMASCSRDPDFPPSIFGSWVTMEPPGWLGDYHLNYNHMAPYYALYSANRLEQARPYYGPLLEAIPRGNYYSEAVTGIPGGILLPVGIGPLGIETTRQSASIEKYHHDWIDSGNIEHGGMFWGQKSNSAYCVVNLAMQFYRTYDPEFTAKVYPFVKGVAVFWENYLTKEGDRYVIYNDAIHEGTVGTMNPILSLGLVHMVMQTACDMSELLGVDADRRPVWKERSEHLSDYPLQVRDGKTVFRYTERGTDWWPSNTLGLQHVYPGGQVGLDSDPYLLEVARNTVDVMRRWSDFNATNSFYPEAVRVGYAADSIWVHLKEYSLHTYPNGFQYDNPHGTENWSTVPNTVNEMLCMGHQGVVRLFPVWPRQRDASFCRIRVEGAFLVSSSLTDGQVGEVVLYSEKGRDLTLLNPWAGRAVEVRKQGGPKRVLRGERIRMQTEAGATYRFRPARRLRSSGIQSDE